MHSFFPTCNVGTASRELQATLHGDGQPDKVHKIWNISCGSRPQRGRCEGSRIVFILVVAITCSTWQHWVKCSLMICLRCQAYLVAKLTCFLEERIVYARESIAKCCADIIRDGDVILTFGSSPLVRQVLRLCICFMSFQSFTYNIWPIDYLQVLLKAAASKRFRLIVVDTRPLNEGLQTLAALSPYVRCVHTPLTGAAATMREATRVILGTSATNRSAPVTDFILAISTIALILLCPEYVSLFPMPY